MPFAFVLLFAILLLIASGSLLLAIPTSVDWFTAATVSLLTAGLWGLFAFWVALLLNGDWYLWPLPIAVATGALGWHRYLRPRFKFLNVRRLVGTLIAATFALLSISLPLMFYMPQIAELDPFEFSRARFLSLPVDNSLPSILANAVSMDAYSRPLFGDWLGSDRPPLQSGMIVLLSPILRFTGNEVPGTFAINYLCQMLWLIGAMILIVGASRRWELAPPAIVTAAFSGVVLFNSAFTWPKLLAAGFLLAAVGTLIYAMRATSSMRQACLYAALAGGLFGLSAQSHGTTLFAVIGFMAIPMIFIRKAGPKRVFGCILAALAPAIALQVPWQLWATTADPPGNRLLKWHLAGFVGIDDRSFFKTLISAYQEIGVSGALDAKIANIQAVFRVPGSPISPLIMFLDSQSAAAVDFMSWLGSISWGFFALFASVTLMISARPAWRRGVALCREFAPALLWLFLTLLTWCLLMFGGGSVVNHQGSFATNLALLLVIGSLLAAISPRAWIVASVLQFVFWAALYLSLRQSWNDHPKWSLAIIVAGIALIGLASIPNLLTSPDRCAADVSLSGKESEPLPLSNIR